MRKKRLSTDKKDILKKLKACRLGLTRDTIELATFTELWQQAYIYILSLLKPLAPKLIFHHIGSTALPGSLAKPILDILIIFDNLHEFEKLISLIEALGFTYKGDCGLPKRHFFTFYNDENTVDFIHLHAFLQGDENIARLLKFKEALLKSPDLLQEYSQLKSQLKCSGISRKDYPYKKTPWIDKVIALRKLKNP